jgi:hemolysin-activating ACP:hemolysin acyltransferase
MIMIDHVNKEYEYDEDLKMMIMMMMILSYHNIYKEIDVYNMIQQIITTLTYTQGMGREEGKGSQQHLLLCDRSGRFYWC